MNPFRMIYKQLINIILVLVLSLGIFSCASKKDVIYFQDASEMNLATIEKEFQPIIEVNDILHITLTSLIPETLEPFIRIKPAQQGDNALSSNPGLSGYLVNVEGNISFPVIGTIKVEGFTRQYMRKLMVKSGTTFPSPVHEGKPSIWHLSNILIWLKENKKFEVEDTLFDVANINKKFNLVKELSQINDGIQDDIHELLAS